MSWVFGPGSAVGGANGAIQFNSSGSFSGSTLLTTNGAGSLSASTHVSASTFYGDGSNLTGITASAVNVADGPEFSLQFRRDHPITGEISGSGNLRFITGSTDELHLTGTLYVRGNAHIGNGFGGGYIFANGDSDTRIQFGPSGSDSLSITVGGKRMFLAEENGVDRVILGAFSTDTTILSGNLEVCNGTASISHLSGCSNINVLSPISSSFPVSASSFFINGGSAHISSSNAAANEIIIGNGSARTIGMVEDGGDEYLAFQNASGRTLFSSSDGHEFMGGGSDGIGLFGVGGLYVYGDEAGDKLSGSILKSGVISGSSLTVAGTIVAAGPITSSLLLVSSSQGSINYVKDWGGGPMATTESLGGKITLGGYGNPYLQTRNINVPDIGGGYNNFDIGHSGQIHLSSSMGGGAFEFEGIKFTNNPGDGIVGFESNRVSFLHNTGSLTGDALEYVWAINSDHAGSGEESAWVKLDLSSSTKNFQVGGRDSVQLQAAAGLLVEGGTGQFNNGVTVGGATSNFNAAVNVNNTSSFGGPATFNNHAITANRGATINGVAASNLTVNVTGNFNNRANFNSNLNANSNVTLGAADGSTSITINASNIDMSTNNSVITLKDGQNGLTGNGALMFFTGSGGDFMKFHTSGSAKGVVFPQEIYLTRGANLSGTIAGPGSYLALSSDKKIIVTSSTGGGGTPGGSNTQVQFNDGGSFGADSTFTFNKTTNVLSVPTVTASIGVMVTSSANGSIRISEGIRYIFGGDDRLDVFENEFRIKKSNFYQGVSAEKTSNFNIGDSQIFLVDTNSSVVTGTLPGVTSGDDIGATYTIKDSGGNANTNNIIINPSGSQKIDGGTQAKIRVDYGAMTLVALSSSVNGYGWGILSTTGA